MAPKVSIVVPIYNLEKYVPRCLDALVNQTLKEIEILCKDDKYAIVKFDNTRSGSLLLYDEVIVN